MRKICFFSMLAVIAVFMSSCSNRDVVKIVTEFAQASAANDSLKMSQLYPNSTRFAKITLDATKIDVDVDGVDGQDNTYKATLNDSIEFIVKNNGGTYLIDSSRGLLKLPADMTFAKGTGQYNPELTDLENSERLNNKDFVVWVLGDIVDELDEKVRVARSDYEIISSHATQEFDDYSDYPVSEAYTAEIQVTVQNELDTEISADAYTVISSVYTTAYFTEPAYRAKTANVETKTIAPHSSMVLTYRFKGEGENIEGMGWIDHIESDLSLNLMNLNPSKLYTPKGGEYDEYLKLHGNSGNVNGLSIHLRGKLGSDENCTFTLNGQSGSYLFDGGTREVTLQTYDPSTHELVVDAYLGGNRIGYFKGIYTGDRYTGKFKNTKKDVSLSFDFY